MPDVPGVTVNRYCSSSLQSIRMAAHAIKAGEGDVFVAAGVETVSRFLHGMADTGPHNPLYGDAEARTAERAEGGQGTWTPLDGSARHLHRHGPDRRERRPVQGRDPRGAGRVRRPVPAAGHRLARERLLGGRDHPGRDHRRRGQRRHRHPGRRHPRRHHRRGPGRAQAGLPPRRHRHRRQRLPAQRRRRRRRSS